MTEPTRSFDDAVTAAVLKRYRAKTGVSDAVPPVEGKSGLASVRLWQALERDVIEELARGADPSKANREVAKNVAILGVGITAMLFALPGAVVLFILVKAWFSMR
ncbi:MAG TPA: hypothetical protein VGV17_10405 [Bosea sp. (in: a-proteobacteria)]|uniref:hypothetical protein n=1 Tax=Bosea sp. (in: a-proteobacteria) TaxID=1871050 RepID=UPI002DDCB607|nr:hypothetical protein [Bosea sp. (in: a-proteobacteria)]HEV2554160.1 hypothetical protein [Bosea sp. (in: a-proteobacteria)]